MSNSDFDPAESWVFPGRQSFLLHELAKLFLCSVQHLWNLIEEKAIIVPQESIDRAKSRSGIQVPRASLVDFIRRRSSRNFVRQGRKKSLRKKMAPIQPRRSSKGKVNAS